jgi:hypothetical protein
MVQSNNLPDKQSDKEQSFQYSDATWLRAIVTAIPYVGGSLDLIFGHRGQVTARRRIEKMMVNLKAELESVNESSIRCDFLESEEWLDLVRLAVERGARIRNTDHIRAITKILKGVATDEITSTGHAEDLIEVLGALRDEEALMLREIYKTRGAVLKFGENIKDRIPVAMHDRMPFLLKRLEALGLITELVGTILGYDGGDYNLTGTGKELCGYVNQDI